MNRFDNKQSLRGDSGGVATFLGAVPARLGAALTMFLIVLGAFLGAGIANIRANAADFLDEPGASAHERDAQTAHLRAIEANPRAIRHAAQTFIGAMVALLGTPTTSANARLMFLVRHDQPPRGPNYRGYPVLICATTMPRPRRGNDFESLTSPRFGGILIAAFLRRESLTLFSSPPLSERKDHP